jgi:hypothetical protein
MCNAVEHRFSALLVFAIDKLASISWVAHVSLAIVAFSIIFSEVKQTNLKSKFLALINMNN